jgi:hypothetical protein
MKKILFLVFSISILFNSCGPDACECAKLKDHSFLIYAGDATDEMKDQKKKIEACAEKFDGLNNAVKICNEKSKN